ncbi:MAG: alpha/beta hydrolase [Thermoanaerobaculia bacterium]|nr:alpha/beta hydrolase [Thermoanaerobaculia bacterium]
MHYPLAEGRIVLRTERDWEHDLEPIEITPDLSRFDFEVASDQPYLNFKPCLRTAQGLLWSEGPNKLAILDRRAPYEVYPHFGSGTRGRVTEHLEIPSPTLSRPHRLRLYLPAGYEENTLKSYPVLYVHDGRNLFDAKEAFLGAEWQLDENLDLLDSMNLIDQTIVVGVYAGPERESNYSQPGYERYGRALVTELKPEIDHRFRTLASARNTSVMGASLGGVLSFYLAWEWPNVFGQAACLSSTFGYRDDLLERVRSEPLEQRRNLRFYLDSGWPGDNYDVTLSMATTLVERDFQLGCNVFYLAFPWAQHNEGAWAARCHLPLQLFAGKLQRAGRGMRLPSAD